MSKKQSITTIHEYHYIKNLETLYSLLSINNSNKRSQAIYKPLKNIFYYLNKGVNINLASKEGYTLLHLYAYSTTPLIGKGPLPTLKNLLKLKKRDYIYSPLEDLIEKYHPNPFVKDTNGNTSAMIIAKSVRANPFQNKDELSDDAFYFKQEELDVLRAYESSYQATETAKALRSFLALHIANTDKENLKNSQTISRVCHNLLGIKRCLHYTSNNNRQK